jgi:hypothetical protein
LVAEALPLPWALRLGGSWGEGGKDGVVRREYARIQAGGNGSAGREAIVLNDRAIDDLFDRQASQNDAILRQVFSAGDSFPADAQPGMLHHAGIRPSRAGISSWHEGRYAATVNARRWDEAGGESRGGTSCASGATRAASRSCACSTTRRKWMRRGRRFR